MESPSGTAATWPANHRAALSIVVLIPDQSAPNRLPSHVGLEYTAAGTQHILAALADADIPASIAIPPESVTSAPELARQFADAGHELVANLTGAGNAPAADDMSWAVGAVTGLPGSTLNTAFKAPFRWIADGTSADAPTIEDDQQVVVPLASYWVDTNWLDPMRPLPPSSLLEHWSVSLADIRTRGGLMTIVLHPHVSGRPGIASQVMRFIDEAIDCGDVWITTMGNVAVWWQRKASESA